MAHSGTLGGTSWEFRSVTGTGHASRFSHRGHCRSPTNGCASAPHRPHLPFQPPKFSLVVADINALSPAATLLSIYSHCVCARFELRALKLFQLFLSPVIATSALAQDHTSEQSDALVRIIAFSTAFSLVC